MGGWDEIELSERYLVSGMYDEAMSIASSVLKDLLLEHQEVDDDDDMLESAGMVLVQALARTSCDTTLNQLLHLFGSLSAIPIHLFLAGVCFQLSQGAEFQDTTLLLVHQYLTTWILSSPPPHNHHHHYYYYYYIPHPPPPPAASNSQSNPISTSRVVVQVDDYLQLVEIYLLAVAINDLDAAVSWLHKASLPEDKRLDLLTRLQSLYSHNSIPDASMPSSANQSRQQLPGGGSEEPSPFTPSGENNNNTNQSILKLSQQRVGWFRNITLKLGNRRMTISNGKLAMACLLVLVYFVLKRKRILLKENLKRRAMSVRKGLVELWELAFSYQVNPLAAVQPISTATRGSR